jgi:hypothetical protein
LWALSTLRPRLLIEDHTDVYPFVAAMGSRDLCCRLLFSLGYTVETVRYSSGVTPDRDFLVATP